MQFFKFFAICIVILVFGCKNQQNKKINTNITETINQEVKQQDTLSTLEVNLAKQGINFYARGNKPFWSLDMDFEGNYHFKTQNGKEIYVPNVQGEKAMDANITRFNAEVEKGTLIITIAESLCKDTIADKTFDFSVNVKFKYGIDEEFKEFSGCGNYLPDLTLHDIWVLESINDKPLDLNENQERPRFEFFPMKKEIIGNTGCNDFRAKFSISDYQEIKIEPARMTKILCKDMENEKFLAEHVFGKNMKYSKNGLILILTNFNGNQLKFKKTD